MQRFNTAADLCEPWLAVGVVALMTQARITNIQNWTARGLVPFIAPAIGKKTGTRYSFASAVYVGAMNHAVEGGGLAPRKAMQVSEAAVKRLFDNTDKLRNEIIDDVAFFNFQNGEHVFFSNNDAIPGGKNFHYAMAGYYCRIDCIIAGMFREFGDLSEEFNQMALEGRLKPFPKHLK